MNEIKLRIFSSIRGEVTASVKRIVMTMEVKQKLPTNESHPKLTGKAKSFQNTFVFINHLINISGISIE